MRGRWPWGLEYIDQLDGSTQTKERLKAILDTLVGERRLLEACAQLDIGETRFHQLREAALQAALAAIEPRPAGRPCRTAVCDVQQMQALQQRVQELELALWEAQVREEIALVLPQVRHSEALDAPAAERKKMRQRRVKLRKPR